MKRQWHGQFRSLMVLGCVVALASLQQDARGADKGAPRADMQSAFGKLLKLSQKPESVSAGRDPKKGRFNPANLPDVGGEKVCSAIEFWAATTDKDGNEKEQVSLKLHKWQPKERFYLYFRSAMPILVSLYQLYPETGHPNAGESRLVLPDTKFPKSLQAVAAGEKVKLPILLEMDNTRADEMMGICVQVLGASEACPTNNEVLDHPAIQNAEECPKEGDTNGGDVALRQIKFAARAGKIGFAGKSYAIPKGARFSAVSELPDEAAKPDPNRPEDTAMIAVNAHHIGFLKLTMHKD